MRYNPKQIVIQIVVIALLTAFLTPIYAVENQELTHKNSRKKQKKGICRDKNRIINMLKTHLSEEEMKDLKALYHTDEEAFRKEARKRFKEFRAEVKARDQKLKKHTKNYYSAKTKNEKKLLLEKIEKITRDEFDKKMEINRKRLEQTEKRLKELRKKYEERKKNAEKIIQKRIQQLIADPALKW